MERNSPFLAFAFVALMLSACGATVHNTVAVRPDQIGAIEEISVEPVEVDSDKQTPEARYFNLQSRAIYMQWRAIAQDGLRLLLANKRIPISNNAPLTIACRVYVMPPSPGLSYFIGPEARGGIMEVLIELRDRNGNVRYATDSKAGLAGGIFGGDMSKIGREVIESAIRDFGSRL